VALRSPFHAWRVLPECSSVWQDPYGERVIGSIRRGCLDRMAVLSADHLRRILGSYIDYYHGARSRLSLYSLYKGQVGHDKRLDPERNGEGHSTHVRVTCKREPKP
jgi:hypothetical protein